MRPIIGARRLPGRARGLVAAALGVLAAVAAGPAGAAELSGALVRISGPVEVRPLGEAAWRAAALRAVLHPGDMVRTGPGGAAEVALVHGVFRMHENTVLILPPPRVTPVAAGEPGALRVLLYRGRALFQVLRERLQGTFEVITPSVIVGVKGTTFGVEQGTAIGVVVFDGAVEARAAGRPGEPPVTVAAGHFTTFVQGRLTPPRPLPPGGPGALWTGGPWATEAQPLAAPPAPSAPPPPPTDVRLTGPGVAAPALAPLGLPPAITALGPGLPPAPSLTRVGGPQPSACLDCGAVGPSGGGDGRGGKGKGRGKDKGKGGGKGKGKGGGRP